MNKNEKVTTFLDDLNHPLRSEIDLLRTILLGTNNQITENIKWNGPNFVFDGEDRITMRVQPPKQIQLIFHRGAKVKTQPTEKLINDDQQLLEWRGNDRAIIGFKSLEEIEKQELPLRTIIEQWLSVS